ncbi:TonB-dependent receptor [Mongoliibacter ruber]|uniref:Iron complex outermembrane receptor protein n=1 Tax=Mongoliibacter ruber TaxID=1750599 RepID=A0A2T0WKK7_9BACT|nr:TonB-dependent receptor [Mongoliibacter ruber]PRY87044.1 iron complex outermembrane receptor protein [Mongoliibacter ruber]
MKLTIKCLAAVFFSVSSYLVSQAQTQERQLDEVIVTAQKQEENQQEVPVSISSLTDKDIRQFRLWNNRDLSGVFPNFYAAHSGDGRTVNSIRGISTTSYDPAVATYIDGVIQFDLDTYINPLLDVERIEVLRGPQGTLYGRNAMGGVINIITKKPSNETKGFFGLDFGNYKLGRYSMGVQTPLIKDKLFLGVSGLYETHGGFYTNDFFGNNFDRRSTFLGNYNLRYLASNKWSMTLNVKNNHNRNDGAFPLAGSISQALENPFVLNQNSPARMRDDIFNASLNIEYTGENINFSSQTAYQENYRIYEGELDGDFSPLDIVNIFNDYGRDWNRVSVWTQEMKISSARDSESKFSWLTGVFGFIQDEPVKQATNFGADGPVFGAPANASSILTNIGNNRGFAWFGSATYQLTDKFDVNLGMRYDIERRELRGFGEFQAQGMPAPIVVQPEISASANFSAFSPKAVLSYKLNQEQLLFASFARGFRAGGLTPISSDPSESPLQSFDPEFSNNFEVGMKNDFLNNTLRWNVSAFFTTVDNIQVPQLVFPDAIVITRNEGQLTSKGLESELTALVGNNFTFGWNAGITDARFTTLDLAAGEENTDYSGNRQLFTPNFTSLALAQYQKVLNSEKEISLLLRAEWQYIGETFFDLPNTLSQDPYQLFNARVGLNVRNIELGLWMRNITNTRYVAYAYNFGAAHLGEPATFGFSGRLNF